MYNVIGIDVSRGKSTVAVLQLGGTVICKFFDVSRTFQSLKELTDYFDTVDGDTRIAMKCIGRYHEPVFKVLSGAGLPFKGTDCCLSKRKNFYIADSVKQPTTKFRFCTCGITDL